jgi:hypothetical protein
VAGVVEGVGSIGYVVAMVADDEGCGWMTEVVEVLLLRFCMWVNLQLVLNYFSAKSY